MDFLEKVGEGGLTDALGRLAERFTSAAESGGGFATRIGQVLGSVVDIASGAVTAVKAGFEAIAGATWGNPLLTAVTDCSPPPKTLIIRRYERVASAAGPRRADS